MAQQGAVPTNSKKGGIGSGVFKFTASDSSFRAVKPLSLSTVYYDRLGFMCRQEVKMEKITKTSLRFRLGSVGYTDRMEGKLNAVAAP
ncbi:hypothetical protein NIASO_15000 [Niabella soli DSM 19437]|uniref:Uncharacterized protein n=2 Tax=Niabella TaxID=379899 RepID=W0F7Q4_9BACT|nr:hypothetical protein NIASO_15000 [Niabella soli DSM 19437]